MMEDPRRQFSLSLPGQRVLAGADHGCPAGRASQPSSTGRSTPVAVDLALRTGLRARGRRGPPGSSRDGARSGRAARVATRGGAVAEARADDQERTDEQGRHEHEPADDPRDQRTAHGASGAGSGPSIRTRPTSVLPHGSWTSAPGRDRGTSRGASSWSPVDCRATVVRIARASRARPRPGTPEQDLHGGDVRARDAAVDQEVGGVDEGGVVAGEEGDGGGDLVRPRRTGPTGMWTSRRAARSGSLANSSCSSGVLTGPGQSALTRMPSRANCTPSSRDMASTPPLEAVYEICEVAAPITRHEGRGVDDGAPALAPHVGDGGLAAQVDGGEVDLLDALPGLQAGGEDGVVVGRRDARVVEGDVDAAVGVVRRLEQRLDLLGVGDVDLYEDAADLLGGGLAARSRRCRRRRRARPRRRAGARWRGRCRCRRR